MNLAAARQRTYGLGGNSAVLLHQGCHPLFPDAVAVDADLSRQRCDTNFVLRVDVIWSYVRRCAAALVGGPRGHSVEGIGQVGV